MGSIVSDIIKEQHCIWKPIEGRAGTQNWCNSNCVRSNGIVSNHCKEICHKACGNITLMNQSYIIFLMLSKCDRNIKKIFFVFILKDVVRAILHAKMGNASI